MFTENTYIYNYICVMFAYLYGLNLFTIKLISHQWYRLKQIITKSKYNTAEARCSKLPNFRFLIS